MAFNQAINTELNYAANHHPYVYYPMNYAATDPCLNRLQPGYPEPVCPPPVRPVPIHLAPSPNVISRSVPPADSTFDNNTPAAKPAVFAVQMKQKRRRQAMIAENKQKNRKRGVVRAKSIKETFEVLRNTIPVAQDVPNLPQVKTLRLASQYIAHLTQILSENGPNDSAPDSPPISECCAEGSFEEFAAAEIQTKKPQYGDRAAELISQQQALIQDMTQSQNIPAEPYLRRPSPPVTPFVYSPAPAHQWPSLYLYPPQPWHAPFDGDASSYQDENEQLPNVYNHGY